MKESAPALVLEDDLKNLPRFSPAVVARKSAAPPASGTEKASSGSIVPVQYDKRGDSLKIARDTLTVLLAAPPS